MIHYRRIHRTEHGPAGIDEVCWHLAFDDVSGEMFVEKSWSGPGRDPAPERITIADYLASGGVGPTLLRGVLLDLFKLGRG